MKCMHSLSHSSVSHTCTHSNLHTLTKRKEGERERGGRGRERQTDLHTHANTHMHMHTHCLFVWLALFLSSSLLKKKKVTPSVRCNRLPTLSLKSQPQFMTLAHIPTPQSCDWATYFVSIALKGLVLRSSLQGAKNMVLCVFAHLPLPSSPPTHSGAHLYTQVPIHTDTLTPIHACTHTHTHTHTHTQTHTHTHSQPLHIFTQRNCLNSCTGNFILVLLELFNTDVHSFLCKTYF